MTESTGEIFIYNGAEVVMTGRTATRKKPEVKEGDKPKRARRNPKEDSLVEVTPVDLEVGSWKQWVRTTDLYEIQ